MDLRRGTGRLEPARPQIGSITLTDTIPAGLGLVSMSGAGWNCSANTCARGDVLNPGASYPPITVTVNVTTTTAAYVVNQVGVSGGGSPNASADDPTIIGPLPPVLLTPANGATGASLEAQLTWTVVPGVTSYVVGFGTSPQQLQSFAASGTSFTLLLNTNTTYYWSVTVYAAYSSASSAVWSFTTGAVAGLQFVPSTPCRIMDTRNAAGTFGGPAIAGGATRNVPIPQGACNIPSTALAYSLNITVVPPGPLQYLTVWPTGQPQPYVSTLNSYNGATLANAAIVPAGTNGQIGIYVSDTTNVIVDINGYFVPPGSAPAGTTGLAFYPVTPCRVADSRGATGPFGGPSLAAGATRAFNVPSSSCGIPTTAQAYSLNVTAVPPGPLGYLTTWPTAQPQPLVSTLNALQGQIAANAAIVPAGANAGDISVFVSDPSNVVIDINGYFAPPGNPGALYFYPVTPCRVADTRNAAGTFGGPSLGAGSTRAFPIPSSACALPSTAQAYSLNMTAVPPGPLLYLSAWPAGQSQPVVSTLNDQQGQVVANAAIVPAGASGAVSVFVSDATNLIIDVIGYFAQ